MSPARFERFKIGEKDFPAPRWLIHTLAALLVLGLTVWGGLWLGKQLDDDLSSAEHLQLKLAALHFGEPPAREGVAYSDERGELRAMEFHSGDASMVRRVGAIRQTCWLGDPSQAAPPPMAAVLGADVTLTSVVHAGGPPEVFCRCNFAGEFEQYDGERYGEWLRIYRRYRHGCSLWWMRNTVYNFDEVDGNGSPVLHFTACAHG